MTGADTPVVDGSPCGVFGWRRAARAGRSSSATRSTRPVGADEPAERPPPTGTRVEARLAVHASGLLRAFNQAGVLAAADVHVARRLPAIAGEDDEAVALAVALAVRAPRLGHVHVDLARIRDTAAVDAEEPVDLARCPGPTRSPGSRGWRRAARRGRPARATAPTAAVARCG